MVERVTELQRRYKITRAYCLNPRADFIGPVRIVAGEPCCFDRYGVRRGLGL